ncbi:MAG: hypothetical protein JJE39_05555 [Vicinamibacteria bacterium]|nr:hypothetical protein [Vicinamibacteria bacterium]
MSSLRFVTVLVILSGFSGILALPRLVSRSPSSLASLALGTDDAFAVSGLEPRENQIGGGALRWLRPKAAFRFDGVGPGFVDIDLVVRGHRTELTLVANGARVGSLLPGQGHFASRIRLTGGSMVLGIETDGFAAAGRTLGTQIVSLRVQPGQMDESGPGGVPMRLWLTLAALFLVSVLAQVLSGLSLGVCLLPSVALLLMLLPAGLWRSSWLFECATLLGLLTVLSAWLARHSRGDKAARGWLQVALFLSLTIHGVLPPSPLVIQSDVQLHGNKLAEVARGNWFPTSRTDHKPPYEIPYGFSFYGVLTPWGSTDVANVRVVREGAAAFASLSALALAWALGRVSASLAAASLVLWATAPVNIKTMGFGNLSNVFAQAIFVLFLVAAGLMPRGWKRAALLTSLVALSATAHLSSFIVLFTLLLATFLFPQDRNSPAFKPLFAGLAMAASYYASFFPMILKQLPRLLGERGGSAGVFDPWRLPNQILDGAGWPLVSLIALSMFTGKVRDALTLGRSLALTGFLLAIAALVSPVEVRYLLALVPLLATVGASVFAEGEFQAFPRQGLTAVVDLPGLRLLSSRLVTQPLAAFFLAAALVNGALVLLDFIPVSR